MAEQITSTLKEEPVRLSGSQGLSPQQEACHLQLPLAEEAPPLPGPLSAPRAHTPICERSSLRVVLPGGGDSVSARDAFPKMKHKWMAASEHDGGLVFHHGGGKPGPQVAATQRDTGHSDRDRFWRDTQRKPGSRALPRAPGQRARHATFLSRTSLPCQKQFRHRSKGGNQVGLEERGQGSK